MINHYPQFDIVPGCSFPIKLWKLSKHFGTKAIWSCLRILMKWDSDLISSSIKEKFNTAGTWWDRYRAFHQDKKIHRDKSRTFLHEPVNVKFMTCVQSLYPRFLLRIFPPQRFKSPDLFMPWWYYSTWWHIINKNLKHLQNHIHFVIRFTYRGKNGKLIQANAKKLSRFKA